MCQGSGRPRLNDDRLAPDLTEQSDEVRAQHFLDDSISVPARSHHVRDRFHPSRGVLVRDVRDRVLPRCRYYRISAKGRERAQQESKHLAALVAAARAKNLLAEGVS